MPFRNLDLSAYPVLVVDDEQDNVKPLLRAMERRGMAIRSVASPDEAWRILETQTIAVVLSDQRMPNASGVDFLANIAERHPKVIRILFTGFTDHDTAVAAINRGKIFRYIVKSQPIDDVAQVLLEAIRHYAGDQKAIKQALEERELNKAEAALAVLRDARYDWGNIVLTQKINFQNLFDLLSATEGRFNLDLTELKKRCEEANQQVENSLKEYFSNSFFDSGITEDELFSETELFIPVHMAINIIKPKIDESRIAIRFDRDSNDSIVLPMQRERLKAAIGLLLHNAVESIEGAGTVTVSLEHTTLKKRPMVDICIKDTGKGIPPDVLPRIFDPLFKTLDKQGHMGIGLTFVKSIVAAHRGEISVQSTLGEGSTFTVRLPLV